MVLAINMVLISTFYSHKLLKALGGIWIYIFSLFILVNYIKKNATKASMTNLLSHVYKSVR